MNNTPAFPSYGKTYETEYNLTGAPGFKTLLPEAVSGMSLRDYFAAKAMQAQLSIEGMEGCDKENIAAMAYELANEMLKQREKQ